MTRKNKTLPQMTVETMLEPKHTSTNRTQTQRRTTQDSYIDTQASSSVVSRNGVYIFGIVVFLIAFLVAFAICFPLWGVLGIGLALIVGILAVMSIRIAPQWEKAIILRLGQYNRTAGPGLYVTIPVIEHTTAYVDQRIHTTTFCAEEALTEDLVPIDVDAVLFWMVWNPTKACMEVENYTEAVVRSAQTALRDAIGCIQLADISNRRKQLDASLQELMEDKCAEWGITVSSVEIRNILVPEELQYSLSKQAQAERDRAARLTLAEAERDISEIYVEAAEVYARNELAVQIRSMNLVNEGVKDAGGMVVVPSAYSEGFSAIDGLSAGKRS